ncbi:hypothetical protein K432DRAFT_421081 [Lepidopterella palustris CBS 459.81]|uniref:Uncharacterized protein n=1 Tax=Lepidopterella palustris CBS 459.81 TaxID=1314670 RepID=A0A8E2JKS4_9PEZI|nr:hypothetical protein K432DRAFT_421081 [Lepidopterella palustris CBS 459.81]
MSFLVKLVGSGIGLATEVHAHRKEKKALANSPYQSPTITPQTEPSSYMPSNDDSPPQYAELPEDQARELIAKGQAIRVENREEADEEDWQLDEAAEDVDPPAYAEASQQETDNEFERALANLPPPNLSQRLPCAVILPQRRPRSKARGFVRAYAPLLGDCSGIDQTTFIAFLNSFDKASKASPILDVVQLGAGIAGMVPSVTIMITTTIVQVAVGVAKEVQTRKRTNSFLDEMNKKLFTPRGLYCLIMSFKPDASRPVSAGQVNVNDSILKYHSEQGTSKIKNTMQGLRVASGKTYGEIEMPEAAPLVFPALDQVLDADPDGKKPNAFKRGGEFVANYGDRRAQAKYNYENPDSKLTMQPPPKFASRYADPNHPANSGSLVALISGGHIQGPHSQRQQGGGRRNGGGPLGLVGSIVGAVANRGGGDQHGNQYDAQQGRGQYGGQQGGQYGGQHGGQHGGQYGGQQDGQYGYQSAEQEKYEQQQAEMYNQRGGMGMGRGFGRGRGIGGGRGGSRPGLGGQGGLLGTGVGKEYTGLGPIGVVKRIMRQDVLYLMVVNMPTDEEIAESKERLDAYSSRG